MRDLHLDPDGLLAAADDLARAIDVLEAAPARPEIEEVLRRLPDGRRLAAECDAVHITMVNAAVELAELRTTVRRAVAVLEAADRDGADRLRRAGEPL